MKGIKLTSSLSIVSAILVFASCSALDLQSGSNKNLRFTASTVNGFTTKGAIIKTDIPKTAENDSCKFLVHAFLEQEGRSSSEPTPHYVNGAEFSYSSSNNYWSSSSCYWRNQVKTNFWAIYPSAYPGTVTFEADNTDTDAAQKTAYFSYTMTSSGSNNDAANQKDILFAYARNEYNSGNDIVNFCFYHALSAITFVAGKTNSSYGIGNVTIGGIKNKGNCTMTGGPAESPSDDDGKVDFNWTIPSGATLTNFTQDMGISGTDIKEGMNISGKTNTFFVIPQTIDPSAQISVTFVSNAGKPDVTKTITYSQLGTDKFEAGKRYNYKISFDGYNISIVLNDEGISAMVDENIDKELSARAELVGKTEFETALTALGSGKSTVQHIVFQSKQARPEITASTTPQIFSTATSPEKIYGEIRDGVLYVTTPALKIIAPNSMAGYFRNYVNLQDISFSGFDTSEVTDMSSMFRFDDGYNSKLTSITGLTEFDTRKVTKMYNMFHNCKLLTSLDLTSFETDNVADISCMFKYCIALTTIDINPSKFNTGKVYSMYGMFQGCKALTSFDFSGFNTANVVNIYQMFSSCEALSTLDISSFNTAKATDTHDMFSGCINLVTLTLGPGFNTSNVANMNRMFSNCKKLQLTHPDDLNFDTANVTDMASMFYGCEALTSLDISNYNTDKVYTMLSMFYGCKALTTLTLGSNFNAHSTTTTKQMFYDCENLKSLDLSNFATWWQSESKLLDTNKMFSCCFELESLTFTTSFYTDNVTDMRSMFAACFKLKNLDLSRFNTGKVTDMNQMFYNCQALEKLTLGANFTATNVTTTYKMFDNCNNLIGQEKILGSGEYHLDLSNFASSESLVQADYMFNNCNKLRQISLSSGFNTSNVPDMSYMFSNCNELTTVDLTNFDTENVSNMRWMFYNCNALTNLDVSHFNTSNATDMNSMFYGCKLLSSLTVTGFNTSKVTDMGFMFFDCESLTVLDLSSFNLSICTTIEGMLQQCHLLRQLDLGTDNATFTNPTTKTNFLLSSPYSVSEGGKGRVICHDSVWTGLLNYYSSTWDRVSSF